MGNVVAVLELAIGSGSLSLWEGQECLASVAPEPESNRSEDALIHLENLFLESRKCREHLSAIVCSRGPGGYTGIRVGLATARGLSRAMQVPAFGYTTIEALLKISENGGETAIAIDAGRNQYLLSDDSEMRIVSKAELSDHLRAGSIEMVVAAVADFEELRRTIGNSVKTLVNASKKTNEGLYRVFIDKEGEGSSLSPVYGRKFG